MEEKIIETFKIQHQNLKAILTDVKDIAGRPDVDAELILKRLKEFEISLQAHLQLEDDIFYPQLLEKQKKKGMETKHTEEFIAEMKAIASAIALFSEKYDRVEKIVGKMAQFKMDLDDIIATLLLRVESEEDGVYLYWSL